MEETTMRIKQMLATTTRAVTKHSPMILTGVGIVGLGATAYLSYKSAKKMDLILADAEEKMMNDEVVDKVELGRDIVAAIAAPVIVGTLSIVSISASYKILTNRNSILAGALGAAINEHTSYRKRVRDEYGEEVDNTLATPTTSAVRVTTDKNGKAKEETHVQANVEDKTLTGRWYFKSEEYVEDDHSYNQAYIKAAEDKLDMKLFSRGHLLLNEVLEELGFERTRTGALMGWSTVDRPFSLGTVMNKVENEETGFMEPQIYVYWNAPKYIYDDMNFGDAYKG